MIEFKVAGNIFDEDVDCLVNPVNCVGVMGAGLAEQFKKRYPKNYRLYHHYCNIGYGKIGEILPIIDYRDDGRLQLIINFPTKAHWSQPSKLEYIISGMVSLVKFLNFDVLGIKSMAIPALGCGLGGLDWLEVKPFIVNMLNEVKPDIKFIIMEPT